MRVSTEIWSSSSAGSLEWNSLSISVSLVNSYSDFPLKTPPKLLTPLPISSNWNSPNLYTGMLSHPFPFLKNCFLIGVQLLYSVSAEWQSESVIHIYVCIYIPSFLDFLPIWGIFFPFSSPQSIEQSSLSQTGGSHELSALPIVSTVYICQSQYIPVHHSLPLPPIGVHNVCFLSHCSTPYSSQDTEAT